MTRRDIFNSRLFGSQEMHDSYEVSCNYFILVGIFFHFWGYVDLYIEERGSPDESFESKLKKLPQLKISLENPDKFLGMSSISDFSVKKIRENLAHNPMHIPHRPNIGAENFQSGWRFYSTKNDLKGPSQNIPKDTERYPYWKTIKEAELLKAIIKLILIIDEYKIDSEMYLSFLIFKKMDFDLDDLIDLYIRDKNHANGMKKSLHKLDKIEMPVRKKIKFTEDKVRKLTKKWILESKQLENNEYMVIGLAKHVINGRDYEREVKLISTSEIECLKDLGVLHGIDWV